MLANSNAWSSCIFLDRPTQKAPFKVSPAPVVSFTSTFMAGRVMTVSYTHLALMNMVSNPEVYMAVDDKIVDFYLKANEVVFESTKGMLDAIIIANDFGSQQGLMLSREMIHDFVMQGAKKIIEQAHSYGVKVIYHSCGAIFDAMPELIEAGADFILSLIHI